MNISEITNDHIDHFVAIMHRYELIKQDNDGVGTDKLPAEVIYQIIGALMIPSGLAVLEGDYFRLRWGGDIEANQRKLKTLLPYAVLNEKVRESVPIALSAAPVIVRTETAISGQSDVIDATIAERGKVYGDPKLSHRNIGLSWTALIQQHYGITLDHPLPPEVVALMMVTFKAQRSARVFHADNYVDLHAYGRFAEEFQQPPTNISSSQA